MFKMDEAASTQLLPKRGKPVIASCPIATSASDKCVVPTESKNREYLHFKNGSGGIFFNQAIFSEIYLLVIGK